MPENKEQKNNRLKIGLLFLFVLIFFGLTILFHSQFISDTIKNIIVPELELATGQKLEAKKFSINILPLYIVAKDLIIKEPTGNTILSAKEVKAYASLSEIFNKRIILRRLVIEGPVIGVSKNKLEEIIKRVKAYLEKEREEAFKVKIKVVEVFKGDLFLSDEMLNARAEIKGLSGEFIIGDIQKLDAKTKELKLLKEGWPEISCSTSSAMDFKKDRIEIKKLQIDAYGSKIRSSGYYSEGKGAFSTEISLIVRSIKKLLKLETSGEGSVSVKGNINLIGNEHGRMLTEKNSSQTKINLDNVVLDLKLSGGFYLQTLMEILRVKEKVEGFTNFEGQITGRLNDILARGKANMKNGNLFGVDINTLATEITYKNGLMEFKNGNAHLYNGSALAEASIHLPVVDHFTLNIKFQDADSKPLLNLIGWDPGIPPGKADGELFSEGRYFNPIGNFIYRSHIQGQRTWVKDSSKPVDDVLYRIKSIKGAFSLNHDVLSLSNLLINTNLTNAELNGVLDIKAKTINLRAKLHSEDSSDLALPYYKEIKGIGDFSGDIKGTFDDPKISGKVVMTKSVIEEYPVLSIEAFINYQKNLLEVYEGVFKSENEQHSIKGKILFPEAQKLFDLSKPIYDISATIKNADFGKAVKIFYRDFDGTGKMNADIKLTGKGESPQVKGKGTVEKATVFKLPFDSGASKFEYSNHTFFLTDAIIRKGDSLIKAGASFSSGDKFTYNASSEKFYLKDATYGKAPENAVFSFESKGHGTFDNPDIFFLAKATGGTFRGKNIINGTLTASIKNRDISINGSLFNESLKIKGNGYFDEKLPWNAEITIQQGRYDFIASTFFKEIPEDLQLNLEGIIDLKGDRNNLSATANIEHFNLSLYGQTFTNDTPLHCSLNNKKFSIKMATIKSGASSFKLSGGFEIGKEYDLMFEGRSNLAPLKGLSRKIGYLKGDSEFKLSISGRWDDPEINGNMILKDTSFGLKDFPSYISSINGRLNIDEDRIVLESLSGKIGGGDVSLSGVVYLKGLSIKRYYIQASVDNVTTTYSKDFSVTFDGKLLCRGTSDSMNITGDVKIKKGRYKEMVEWRSWLLAVKPKETIRPEVSIFEKAQLNIRISGDENILIDNNIARTPVKIRGDMILKGSISSPVIFGRVESNEGYVYFRNNEFKIIFASVDFADPNRIKPIINLTAETLVKGYNIRLALEGQMDHFNLALSSDPRLDEVDILALLTVGQVGKQLKGLEGGIGAGEATSFITGKVQDVIEERLRSITGLDRFQVEPYVSTKTGTIGPQFTVSKRLIGDRLFVTYTNSIGASEEQIIKIEYLVGKNISLIGLRDERGSIGGDIKFRFEFK